MTVPHVHSLPSGTYSPNTAKGKVRFMRVVGIATTINEMAMQNVATDDSVSCSKRVVVVHGRITVRADDAFALSSLPRLPFVHSP